MVTIFLTYKEIKHQERLIYLLKFTLLGQVQAPSSVVNLSHMEEDIFDLLFTKKLNVCKEEKGS